MLMENLLLEFSEMACKMLAMDAMDALVAMLI